jgi:uncharacterized protein (TIGR04255 family)
MTIPARPAHLPIFNASPLNEVVVGVQFTPPVGYNQLAAGDVWKLFRAAYPETSELPPLPPTFETFGSPGAQQIQLNFGPNHQHNRYWFSSRDGTELLQFQNDRFMHNWRKLEGRPGTYPTFDVLVQKFQSELLRLSDYFKSLPGNGKQLTCTQAEVTYINHVIMPKGSSVDPSPTLSFVQFAHEPPDDFSFVSRRALRKPNGSPFARLICEALTAVNPSGENMLVLNITVRGNPGVGTIGNILEFLRSARDVCVLEFDRLTTDHAHELWGRIDG